MALPCVIASGSHIRGMACRTELIVTMCGMRW